MTRSEALHILGLTEAATADDVRTAHRELAQMLHPDKFEGNKRLHARAEQQMRSINAARDYLLKNAASSARVRSATATGAAGSSVPGGASASACAQARAQARSLLVQQLASVSDQLKRARYLIAGGLLALLIGFRLRGVVVPSVANSAGLTALAWGAQDLTRLGKERRLLRARLKELVAEE